MKEWVGWTIAGIAGLLVWVITALTTNWFDPDVPGQVDTLSRAHAILLLIGQCTITFVAITICSMIAARREDR